MPSTPPPLARRMLLLVALTALAALLVAPAAPAETSIGSGVGDPSVAFNTDAREHLAVWSQAGRVVARRVGRDERPLAAAVDLGAGGLPGVAHDPDHDQYLVAWWSDERTLVAQRFSASAAALGPAARMWSGGYTEIGPNAPSLVYNPRQQEFVVAWGRYDGTYSATTRAQRVSAAGSPVGEPVVVGDGSGVTAALNTATGGYVVAERNPGHGDPPGSFTHLHGLSPGLAPVTSFSLGETTNDGRPLLAAGPGGESLVIATGWYSGATTAYRFDQDLETRGERNWGVPAGCCRAVAANPVADGYTLVWGALRVQHVRRDGVLQGSPITLSTTAGSPLPSIAVDPQSGEGLVVRLVGAEGAETVRAARIPAPLPAKVAGLRARAGDTRVTLTWDAVPGATRYGVSYGEVGGASGPAVADATGTTMTVPNLRNGRTYWFRIAAKSAAGTGPRSDEVRATPIALPAKVANLRVTAGDRSVVLRWDAAARAQTYGLAYGEVGGPNGPRVPDVSGTALTVPNLVNGRRYWFRIAGKNTAGTGPQSDTGYGTPRPPAT